MRIILSAYACQPDIGSEEGVGWSAVVQTAKNHEVWVLTRSFYRSYIESELKKNPLPKVTFIYIEPCYWHEDFRGRQGAVQLHYYLWQILAYWQAKKLHKEINFDLVRHVTYVKFWSPSFLSLLPIPFIWGPVGGGESIPDSFRQDFSWQAKLYERARDIGQYLGSIDPFTRLTAQKSVLALATSVETAEKLLHLGAKNVQIYSQVGLSQEEIKCLSEFPMVESRSIRFISVGRLLHWKGFHLGIRAFALANIPDAEYWIIGKGPELDNLHKLAENLGIVDRLKFWGALSRPETLDKMSQCHALVHPSLHESGGFVCTEMMGLGRPVICLDLGGPGNQITGETGIKIPAHHPQQVVEAMSLSMQKLAQSPELITKLGKAGQIRVKEVFDWEVKNQFFEEVYARSLA